MNENKALTPERLGEIRASAEKLGIQKLWVDFDHYIGDCVAAALVSMNPYEMEDQADYDKHLVAGDIYGPVRTWDSNDPDSIENATSSAWGFAATLASAVADRIDLLAAHDSLTAQLAEARAEAGALREMLETAVSYVPERIHSTRAGMSLKRVILNALSTPPSHFAKRVELMWAVVEAAKSACCRQAICLSLNAGPRATCSHGDEINDALAELEEHEGGK